MALSMWTYVPRSNRIITMESKKDEQLFSAPRRVLVLMSGGVDSSVAAALLQEQGYEVTGVIMKIWGGEGSPVKGKHHGCYGPDEAEDIQDAARVAAILRIPFQVIDLTKEYKSVVLDYFRHEYLSGRTPNPCVRCNRRIKFSALIDKSQESGIQFDFIASGHYARVEHDQTSDRYLLKKGLDLARDQSYFLSFLTQEQLKRLILPLGGLTKPDVRRIASRFGLPVDEKPDSQNFISGDYSTMIEVAANPGPIKDTLGNVLGQHRGMQYYTVGQHKGLGISTKEPLFVIRLDPSGNEITVGTRSQVYGDALEASELNWIAIDGPNGPLTARARIRYSHKEAEALVTPLNDRSVKVKLRNPRWPSRPVK
jgi:tRNA-uridine 2-sulfurtransferase